MPNRKPYPSDVSDEEWAFVAPYLALVCEDAPQRTHDLASVQNYKTERNLHFSALLTQTGAELELARV